MWQTQAFNVPNTNLSGVGRFLWQPITILKYRQLPINSLSGVADSVFQSTQNESVGFDRFLWQLTQNESVGCGRLIRVSEPEPEPGAGAPEQRILFGAGAGAGAG